MLSHLTPMIAALSLALTAGSSAAWPSLAKSGHRCMLVRLRAASSRAQPARRPVVKRHQLHEMQVLSFGP